MTQEQAKSANACAYLMRAIEMLNRSGEDGFVLRIEQRRIWTVNGANGDTVLVGAAQGELADVKMAGEKVLAVEPRPSVPYGIAKILIAATEDMDGN